MAKGILAGNGNDQNFQGYFRSGGYFYFPAKGGIYPMKTMKVRLLALFRP